MLMDIGIYKQGELGYSCGLYCLFSVAEHYGLELPHGDAPLANVIGAKEEGLKSTGAWKSRVMPQVWGVGVDAMVKLAAGMGLKPTVLEPAGDLEALKGSYLSIALLLCRFDHPLGLLPSYEDSHFVIVQAGEGMLYVGDSHPWKPHVRPVDDRLFDVMWNDDRHELPGWAITFPDPRGEEPAAEE